MSWLDDMEAADPAYPDPGPNDQTWAQYAAARDGLNPADVERTTGPATPAEVRLIAAESAVGGGTGPDVDDPAEMRAWRGNQLHAWPHQDGTADWRATRETETQARDAGLRAAVPQPDGHGSAEYQADASAWGTGRGIGLDGPEAGG